MSEALIKAAVRACVSLSQEIDAISEDETLENHPGVQETRVELITAYNALTTQLSIELNCDARALVRSGMEAELEASRAMLFAQTGLRFPIETKE